MVSILKQSFLSLQLIKEFVMQMRSMLAYLLMINVIGYNAVVRCDDSASSYTGMYTSTTGCACDNCDCQHCDGDSCGGNDGDEWAGDCADQADVWIPVFPPLYVIPTYEDILQGTNANEVLFDSQLADVNQALKTYLRLCIMNGTCDEQQIATLIDAVKEVYKTFVRQSAFLAYVKAVRLYNEEEYQTYQAQLAALQAIIQQAAHQAGAVWFAVEAGTDTPAHALVVSQDAVNTIAITQAQMDQITVEVAALLVRLAGETSQA
jgi:hypothetical protein